MKISNWLIVGLGLAGISFWAYTQFWQKFYFEILGYKFGWNISDPLKIRIDIDIKFTNKTNVAILIDSLVGQLKYGNSVLSDIEGLNIVLPPQIIDVKTLTAKVDVSQIGLDLVTRIKQGRFFDKLLFEGTLTRNGSVINFSKPINLLE